MPDQPLIVALGVIEVNADSTLNRVLTRINPLNTGGTLDTMPRRAYDYRDLERLSPRQRQVMLLAKEGLKDREIAAILDISKGTVEATLKMIYDKLNVRDRRKL